MVVVTGAASALGRRVVEPGGRRSGRRPGRSPLDRRAAAAAHRRRRAPRRRPRGGRPEAAVRGRRRRSSTWPRPPAPRRSTATAVGDGALARRVLDAASAVGTEHVVLLSSAIVYGAWANNPVPITEDAPLRPNPGVAVGVREGRARADAPPSGATPTRPPPSRILRPTVTVSADGNGWLARALARSGVAARHRRRAARPVPRRRRPGRGRRPGPPGPARRPAQRGARRVDQRRHRPLARRRRAAGAAPRAARPPLGRPRLALAPRPHAARAAALHRAPLGDRQRPAQGRRLGSRPAPTRRPTSAPTGPARGRRSARAAARSWRWARRASRSSAAWRSARRRSCRRRRRPPPERATAQRHVLDGRPRPRGGGRCASSPPRTTSPGLWVRSATTRSELDRIRSPPTSVITSPFCSPLRSAGLPGITRRTSAPPRTPDQVGLGVAEVGALDPQPAVGDLAVGEQLVGELAHELDRRGEPEARVDRRPRSVVMPITAPRGVDQRTARPRRLDRRVGLDHARGATRRRRRGARPTALITPVDTAGSPSLVAPMATVAAPASRSSELPSTATVSAARSMRDHADVGGQVGAHERRPRPAGRRPAPR